jgi:hypothetical protein
VTWESRKLAIHSSIHSVNKHYGVPYALEGIKEIQINNIYFLPLISHFNEGLVDKVKITINFDL